MVSVLDTQGPIIQQVPSAYTSAEVIQWLNVINFGGSETEQQISSGKFETSLENLERLTRLHLLAFPFENCDMHYTAEHTMHITPQAMFRNSVIRRRGSYCFGLNTLLLEMLRGLGYRAYGAAARVNQNTDQTTPPELGALSHMVLIVQPDHCDAHPKRFLVDAGFGGAGLVRCMPLFDKAEVMGTTPSEKHRLIKECHNQSCMSEGESLWHLEISRSHKSDATVAWQTLYAFTEAEFFSEDFIRYSFTVSQMPVDHGLFWTNVICVKYFEVESDSNLGSEALVGKYSLLGNQLRRSVGSDSHILRTFATEDDRILTLREVFEFTLGEDAAHHITGRAAALA